MKQFVLFVAILFSVATYGQKKLTIVVDGMEEITGKILIAIYDSESSFQKQPYTGLVAEVLNNTVEVEVELPEGTYAISLFHDVNDNNKLDTGAYGIPTEKYGFSNNASVSMGPPSFENAKFVLDRDKVTRINLK